MKAAVKQVIENNQRIRTTAKEFKIDRMTLARYVTKAKNGDDTFKSHYDHKFFFVFRRITFREISA
jgi:DNA invertase Pin-like site-specific DNA recombinase